MIFWIIAITCTLIALALLTMARETDGASVIFGIIILLLVWLPYPLSREYPIDKPARQIEVINVQKTLDYITFQLQDVEGYEDHVVIKKEAKFVNREFKVYQTFHVNWYGYESSNIEYRFEGEK